MGGPSILSPESHAAREVSDLWWVMLAGSGVVLAVVVLLLAIALLRRRTASPGDDRRASGLVLIGGAAAPVVVLSALFGLALATMPATSAPRPGTTRLTIEVVGKQYFWEARYPGGAVTANEIYVPAGVRVRVRVRTADVIHSFWVPQLNRKIDLIPGRESSILIQADRPGVYDGRCAEYCGLQHAHMAFFVIAVSPARFGAWLREQSLPAAVRGSGLRAFLGNGCGGCHTIRGTPAQGRVGPDLTHVASRSTLAAGTIPNTPGYLAGWIADPQHIKPGNRMPAVDLSAPDLRAILAYLQRLR